MLIKSYKTTTCINGCLLFNDSSNYHYWESRKETTDETEIVNFLNTHEKEKLTILHVGIGNSFVASNLNIYSSIDGISISNSEIKLAKKLNIKNYEIFFLNKLEKEVFSNKRIKKYDIIIDVNLKSFSCCELAFKNLFLNYISILNKNGRIFTGRRGMNWSRRVKPVLSFSLNKLFHKKLKEFDGPKRNILDINDAILLSKKYNLKIFYNSNSNVVYFQN